MKLNGYVMLDYKDGYYSSFGFSVRKQFDHGLTVRLAASFVLKETQRKHLDFNQYGGGLSISKEWRKGWITTVDPNAKMRAYDGNYPGMNERQKEEGKKERFYISG